MLRNSATALKILPTTAQSANAIGRNHHRCTVQQSSDTSAIPTGAIVMLSGGGDVVRKDTLRGKLCVYESDGSQSVLVGGSPERIGKRNFGEVVTSLQMTKAKNFRVKFGGTSDTPSDVAYLYCGTGLF